MGRQIGMSYEEAADLKGVGILCFPVNRVIDQDVTFRCHSKLAGRSFEAVRKYSVIALTRKKTKLLKYEFGDPVIFCPRFHSMRQAVKHT